MKDILPSTLSGLIEVALKDLSAVERMKSKYVVNMGTWHAYADDTYGKCSVCLAGSVMAKTLKCAPEQSLAPYDLGSPVNKKLQVINELREGNVLSAFKLLKGIENIDGFTFEAVTGVEAYQEIIEYEDDPQDFKNQMRKLAKNLKKVGL